MTHEGKMLACASCDRPLAELLILGHRPLAKPERVRCSCPYCGGATYPEEVAVRYHLSPAVAFDGGDAAEYRELTAVTAPVREGDLVTYTVLEATCQ